MKKKVLDVTKYKCPMSFLKTKEFLVDNKNKEKIILVKGKKDTNLLSNSLKKNFNIRVVELKDNVYEIQIESN
jgi:SirA-like protein.|tara:strand:- start:116 stop:334 length:219 start_codon:yes stop_codon:yes gene_type:complete